MTVAPTSTTARPPRRVLVVIDVQREYFNGALPIAFPDRLDSLTQVTRAIDAAQHHGVPVVVVAHLNPAAAAAFAEGSPGAALHPDLLSHHHHQQQWRYITKHWASAFAGTDLARVLADLEAEVITLVGYMTNNCVLATAAEGAPHGVRVEVLSDAVGAVHLSNEAGSVDAAQLHRVLMVLLQSNFAAVATTEQWIEALSTGRADAAPRSSLPASARAGAAEHSRPHVGPEHI